MWMHQRRGRPRGGKDYKINKHRPNDKQNQRKRVKPNKKKKKKKELKGKGPKRAFKGWGCFALCKQTYITLVELANKE